MTKIETVKQESLDLQKNETKDLYQVESSRAIQEVQGAIIIANKFPRDINVTYNAILKECQRTGLAETAIYSYPRGGQTVSGPSIRLAEVLARNYKHLDYGIRELSQGKGYSIMEAFCWDMENNVKATRQFRVDHIRYSKKFGNSELSDPRDIYEMTANNGARRLRACILQIIPGDIVEAAVTECQKTLSGGNNKPLTDRVRDMIVAFGKLGIEKDDIEMRLGYKVAKMTQDDLVEYTGIYRSLNDGITKRNDWFNVVEKVKSPKNKNVIDGPTAGELFAQRGKDEPDKSK